MNQLVRFDTTALNRALLGFDRIFNDFENRYANSTTNYPPYNVTKLDEHLYEVTLAVAGFSYNEVVVEVDQDELVIRGTKSQSTETEKATYLHRGLAFRDFERRFTLAEHMEVVQAQIKNGLLSVQVERKVPETLLPRRIEVIDIKE